MTSFEDLSDDLIIAIIEYIPYEDSISIFKELNRRLAWLSFDHPWTQYQFDIRQTDDDTLEKKLLPFEDMNLESKIWSINISPYSMYNTIQCFLRNSTLFSFVNLRALCLNNITTRQAYMIFGKRPLWKFDNLRRVRMIFTLTHDDEDDQFRLEIVLYQILTFASLRHCTYHTPSPLEFSQLESSSSVEYLDLNFCTFQSIYTLLQFTTNLRHLRATIMEGSPPEESEVSQFYTIPPSLTSLKLSLNIQSSDALTNFLKPFSNLVELSIVSCMYVERSIDTSWYQFIAEYLPVLRSFRWISPVREINCATQLQSFNWGNGWSLQKKRIPISEFYSELKVLMNKFEI